MSYGVICVPLSFPFSSGVTSVSCPLRRDSTSKAKSIRESFSFSWAPGKSLNLSHTKKVPSSLLLAHLATLNHSRQSIFNSSWARSNRLTASIPLRTTILFNQACTSLSTTVRSPSALAVSYCHSARLDSSLRFFRLNVYNVIDSGIAIPAGILRRSSSIFCCNLSIGGRRL